MIRYYLSRFSHSLNLERGLLIVAPPGGVEAFNYLPLLRCLLILVLE